MSTLQFRHDTGFPTESRFLDGHFPGNPVVPGAVVLAYLSGCLGTKDLKIMRVERMKFVRPLLPAQPFMIDVVCDASIGKVQVFDEQGAYASARIVLSPI